MTKEQEEALKNEFLKQKGVDTWDDIMTPAYNTFKSGPEGVKFLSSLGKATDSKGDEIKPEVMDENALNKAKATSAADASYDAGTTVEDNGSEVQLENTQAQADDILSTGEKMKNDPNKDVNEAIERVRKAKGTDDDIKVIAYAVKNGKLDKNSLGPKTQQAIDDYLKSITTPTDTQAEAIGKETAGADKVLTDEERKAIRDKNMPTDEKGAAGAAKALGLSAKDSATGITKADFENPENAGNKLQDMANQFGINAKDGFIHFSKDKLPNGKLGVFGTIISALVTAATGGAIPFINFNKIVGTDEQWQTIQQLEDYYNKNMADNINAVNKEKATEAVEQAQNDEAVKANAKGARDTRLYRNQGAEDQKALNEVYTGNENATGADVDRLKNSIGQDNYKAIKEIDANYERQMNELKKDFLNAQTAGNMKLAQQKYNQMVSLETDQERKLTNYIGSMTSEQQKAMQNYRAARANGNKGETNTQTNLRSLKSAVDAGKEITEGVLDVASSAAMLF